ncbi:MAG: DedA family protein [Bacteroidetes bacterium]|nr:DedA family protein [Bacteroidota bacterium]
METIVEYIKVLDPLWIYIAITSLAYIENIVPPFPSDILVVAAGSLIVVGKIHFLLALLLVSVGSTLGFMTMYEIGKWIDVKIVEQGKVKFISIDSIRAVEKWFHRYGYGVVVVNRFLAGSRAVVSFFAGMSRLPYLPTIILSFMSSMVWNILLLYAGYKLGSHWQEIVSYLETYGQIVTIVLVTLFLLYIMSKFIKKLKRSSL